MRATPTKSSSLLPRQLIQWQKFIGLTPHFANTVKSKIITEVLLHAFLDNSGKKDWANPLDSSLRGVLPRRVFPESSL